MMDRKSWLRFELNCSEAPTSVFEEKFCRSFFAIQNNFDERDVVIIKGMPGIENKPVNGTAFQSKFLTAWDWSQIKDSLTQILSNKSTYYPELTKVIVYVKELKPTYLKDVNDEENGIIPKLKKSGVDVEFFDAFEIIDEDVKYENLRDYFKLSTDESKLLGLINKYLDCLYLDEAKVLLDVIKSKLDNLADLQRYQFYIYTGRYERACFEYRNAKEFENFGSNFIKAYDFKKDVKSLLNKAMGLYCINAFPEAKVIVETLLSESEYNEEAYNIWLGITHAELKSYDAVLAICDKKYLSSSLVKKTLGRIEQLEGNLEKAHEWFLDGFECTSGNKLEDRLTLISIWSSKLNDSHDIFNLSLEEKEEYRQLLELLQEVESETRGFTFSFVGEHYNLQGLIFGNILGQLDDARQYFAMALRINDNAVFRFNQANTLLVTGNKLEATKLFEELYREFEDIIAKNKANPAIGVIYQIPMVLSQIYQQEGKLDLSAKVLEELSLHHYSSLDERGQRFLDMVLVNTYAKNAETVPKAQAYSLNLIASQPLVVVYQIAAFIAFNDVKYLMRAYGMSLDGSGDYREHDLLQLSEILYLNGKVREAFRLLSTHLKDFSQETYSDLLIKSGIELGEVDEVRKSIAEYEKHAGGENAYSVFYKSDLYQKMGDCIHALEVIEKSSAEDKDGILLLQKAHLLQRLSRVDELKELLRLILKNYDIAGFSFQNRMNLIHILEINLPQQTIELLYSLIQKSSNREVVSAYKKECFRLSWNEPGLTEKYFSETINTDSMVEITDAGKDKHLFLLDGFSSTDGGINEVYGPTDPQYAKLVGKKLGDKVLDLFGVPIAGIHSEYEITDVCSKYDFLLRNINGNLEALGLGKKLIFEAGKEVETITHFLKASNKRSDSIPMLKSELYDKGLLLLGILSEHLGYSYYEAYNIVLCGDVFNLVSDSEFRLDNANTEVSALLDFSALLTMFKLGIEVMVGENLETFVTQSTVESIQAELLNAKTDLTHRSGKVVMNDAGSVQYFDDLVNIKEAKVKLLESMLHWIGKHCKTKSGKSLLTKTDFEDLGIGVETVDVIKIAREHSLTVYSDDFALRRIIKMPEYGLKAFGSESLLKVLAVKKLITNEAFNDFYLKLMDLGMANLGFSTIFVVFYVLTIGERNMEILDKIFRYCKLNNVSLDFAIECLFECIEQLDGIGEFAFKYPYFERLLTCIAKHYEFSEMQEVYSRKIMLANDAAKTRLYVQLMDEYTSRNAK